MRYHRDSIAPGLLLVALWLVLTDVTWGQALPQSENNFRNRFGDAGIPADPEPPGPTARTGRQFESGTTYGGWQTTRLKDADGNVLAGSANETPGDPGTITGPEFTPTDADGVPIPSQQIRLGKTKLGRTLVMRTVSFSLGSEITRPERKPNGDVLDPDIFAEAEFYFREPANADTGNFYWSPHAQRVFASQPGVVKIDWKERVSGNLFTQTYTVSSSPVKPTKTIYWTERDFNGPVVKVPESRISEVKVIYTETFPEFVSYPQAHDFDPTNPPDLLPPVVTPQNPLDPPGTLPLITQTLWYDNLSNGIKAYNLEGRVFVELLGDLREPDRLYREHLGFEIIDVVQEARPEELRVAIGEKVLPTPESEMTPEDEALIAAPVAGKDLQSEPYLYEHVSQGGSERTLYAIKETNPIIIVDRNDDGVLDQRDEQQSNEVLIYWMETGVMQLEWPKKYIGYIFKWPDEFLDHEATEDELRADYALFARPEDAADADATGVQLLSSNNPVLVYQDDPTKAHAQLTAQNIFYTVPGSNSRSLIRFTNGEQLWFQRVYSRVNQEFDHYQTTTHAVVGTRIESPDKLANAVGYIRQTSGNAFNPNAYKDPFVHGLEEAAQGAIIPVNALPGNDTLEVWWYETSAPPAGTDFAAIAWPTQVQRYQLAWPVTDPDDANLRDEMVLARNDGSGDLGIAATGRIYRQADPNLAGYNPNEEHALMSGGVAWALRDDLNVSTSSEPFVLVDYTAEDQRPAMVVRRVVRENATHTFHYPAPVGVVLQSPMPLPVIELPIDETGAVRNTEVGTPTDVPSGFDTHPDGVTHYERYTYTDRKGTTWIYRGPHADGVNVGTITDASKSFRMHYFYKVQASFDFPNSAVEPGTIVPYLRPFANGTDASAGFVEAPLEVTFTPIWPANPPVLAVAETLGLPKRGLPAVRGQSSAKLVYEQSVAADLSARTRSAKLIDPTREKVYFLSAFGLDKIPDSIATSDYLGKTYFPSLPPHLSQRLYFDPNRGASGALVFVGEFVDAAFGEDYYQLNVMSAEDVAAAQGLVDFSDGRRAAWETAMTELRTTLETFIEDPSRLGTYKVDPQLSEVVASTSLSEIISDDTAVDSYAISASGGGTGYVVMATGDGEAFTPKDEPVSLHVFKVAPPLYRGELKVIASANPLDEKLTLRHSSDFAGDPSDYEFEWLTAQPVSGKPPVLYTYTNRSILANGAAPSWRILNNPTEGYEAARDYHFDDSTWTDTGNLTFNQITINAGDAQASQPHAVLRDTFTLAGEVPIDLYLSLKMASNDGAIVYLNGAEVAVWNVPGKTSSAPATAPGPIAHITLPLVFSVPPQVLQAQNTITVDLYTLSDPGQRSFFDLQLDSQQETPETSGWQTLVADTPRYTLGGTSVLTLTDNYFTMRYRAKAGTPAALATGGDTDTPGGYSRWMTPQLAEGWIKRALAGINPFTQRVTDLFENEVNTDVSILTQAGKRWEGDIALNLANIDDFGLIEIYETILRRGKGLSIEGAPPLNVPAANDALLLAAGYLSDLYMTLGNEALADAANPTIAYGTDNEVRGAEFGDFATALFAFKGQLATVLDEELGLLRGRDDSLQPGVGVSPVYNRLVWNFTRGINSGEVVYSLNYNIKDLNADGAANALDASVQYPQGHGDAYGHYLTALKGYYGLLNSDSFAWTPRIEAVSVLGQPVSIDYQDERKFAAAASAVSKSAGQVLDLTYRQEFQASEHTGWSHLRDGKVNSQTGTARHWGTDEWATRAGVGAYVHWITANSILPEEDVENTGIEKVDRTTVPELDELAAQGASIQTTLDNADARLNPLGLPKGALSFDISPDEIDAGKTHFEQVFDRAVRALRNADFAFDNAKDSTQLLRRQEDGIDERRHAIRLQEVAYENELIELYGTPYPDDIGPGRTYQQGYEGPDLVHYQYVDNVELFYPAGADLVGGEVLFPLEPRFENDHPAPLNSLVLNYDRNGDGELDTVDRDGNPIATVAYSLNAHGEFVKPSTWTSKRRHPGQIQAAISDILEKRIVAYQAADDFQDMFANMADLLMVYQTKVAANQERLSLTKDTHDDIDRVETGVIAENIIARSTSLASETLGHVATALETSFPSVLGFSNDATAPARGSVRGLYVATRAGMDFSTLAAETAAEFLEQDIRQLQRKLALDLEKQAWAAENRQLIRNLQEAMWEYEDQRAKVDVALRDYDQGQRRLQTLIGRGDLIRKNREIFRKRAAAIIQGYRTRDLAFRVFRDEALEKYKTLFDLAARYTFLAARAYDYETGLLDSTQSSSAAKFFDGIVQSRALGVIDESGTPQFSSSTTGDPGLAGVMAQMQGDWDVAKTRLGFNNPDRYRTTFSLRQENYRIVPSDEGDAAWRDKLASTRMDDILQDPDVLRYCLQIGDQDNLPVPGFVIPFSTTIAKDVNFFGKPLAAGDHGFSPSSFSTKIRNAGIALEGYVGLDSPTTSGGSLNGIGANTPADPNLGFLDPNGLSATPYIYLIPVGIDSMRSPPLGDVSTVRSWTVDDQAIPLPFNIGNSDFSLNEAFVSGQSLSEDPFQIRKHQAFRAVATGTVFSSGKGFTNARLIGRSVWNSKWKIVIPGRTLRSDSQAGLEAFQDTVTDIQLYFETYSYAGN